MDGVLIFEGLDCLRRNIIMSAMEPSPVLEKYVASPPNAGCVLGQASPYEH